MSFDYDLYSDTLADGGAVATSDGSYRSVVFVATFAAAVAHSAISWLVEESADNGTTWTTADPSVVIDRKPANAALTRKAFHVGYVGKQTKARATITGGTSPTYTVIYSNPTTGPTYGDGLVGIDA